MEIVLTVAVVAAIGIGIAGLRLDREYQRGVIFRLGRFQAVRGPGLYWVTPLVDQKVPVDIRWGTTDVPRWGV